MRTELVKLLKGVRKGYPDFIPCMIALIHNYQIEEEVAQFLMDNPDIQSDELIKYIYDELIEE